MTPTTLDVLLKVLQGGGSIVIVVVVFVLWQVVNSVRETARAVLEKLTSIDSKLSALNELAKIEGNLDNTLTVRMKP